MLCPFADTRLSVSPNLSATIIDRLFTRSIQRRDWICPGCTDLPDIPSSNVARPVSERLIGVSPFPDKLAGQWGVCELGLALGSLDRTVGTTTAADRPLTRPQYALYSPMDSRRWGSGSKYCSAAIYLRVLQSCVSMRNLRS